MHVSPPQKKKKRRRLKIAIMTKFPYTELHFKVPAGNLQKLRLSLPCTRAILKDNPKTQIEMQETQNLVKIILNKVRESVLHNFKNLP